MVFAQTMDEVVLAGVASQKGINQMILSKQSDQERIAVAQMIGDMTSPPGYFLMIFDCVHHHSVVLQQSQKLNQFMRLLVLPLGGSPIERLKPVIPVERE